VNLAIKNISKKEGNVLSFNFQRYVDDPSGKSLEKLKIPYITLVYEK
jgi:hypothetical protein